jgi:hypothetical protein
MKTRRLTLVEDAKPRSILPRRCDLYALMAAEHAHLDELLRNAAERGEQSTGKLTNASENGC